jgi:hypothetical protein
VSGRLTSGSGRVPMVNGEAVRYVGVMGIETIVIVFGIAIVIAIAVAARKTKNKAGGPRIPETKSGPTFPRK